jgi:hypothetical protein
LSIDEARLEELIEESQDLQADSRQTVKATLPDLKEIGESRRNKPVDLDEVTDYNSRRKLIRNGGLSLGGFAGRGLLAGGFGAFLTALVAAPARADTNMDVQILQTASSLEILAVATYGAALGLPFIANGNPVVKKFAETTMMQHGEHNKAFQAQAKSLGGQEQTQPNPKYLQVVNDAKPGLKGPADVVKLAMALEQVATQTYVNNMTLFTDTQSKAVMASVMGVEAQHLATLRAVDALLAGGAPELIAIPTQLAKLPAAAGSVEFPKPFEGTEKASPPEEGAVK